MSRTKAVVLLSGGLDSCVALAHAFDSVDEVWPLNIYYGQRHARERVSASLIAKHYHLELKELDLHGFGDAVASGTVLTDPNKEVPSNRTDEEMSFGRAPSYVPGRNTIMLALAQAYAEALEANSVYCGVNAVDYSGYVDCRPEFIDSWNQLAKVSTFAGLSGNPIRVYAPLINLTKADIVSRGVELSAPLRFTWSCYRGGAEPCGTCDSCIIRAKAFADVGIEDPAIEGLRIAYFGEPIHG